MYCGVKKMSNSSIWLQFLGILLLIILTLYGIFTFHNESWDKFLEILYTKKRVFLLVLGLRILDWILDYGVWRFLLSLYRVSVSILNSILIYLTQGAGILVPVQLGRVVRGYVLSKKLGLPLDLSLIVEGYMLLLVFNGAFFAFFVFLGIYANMRVIVWMVAFFILSIEWFVLKYGESILRRWFISIPKIKSGYVTYIILSLVCGLGWAINGLIFYYLLQNGKVNLSFAETQLILLGSIFISIISGIPGGIGILEMLLGVSLHWLDVDTPEIIVVVGAFRLITIGLWIPIGWVALVLLGFKKVYKSLRDMEESR